MKNTNKHRITKGILYRLAAITIAVALIFSALPMVSRAAETPNFANYIVFVKFAGDTETELADRFSNVKSLFDSQTTADWPADISVKNYLRKISRGALIVDNYFPQESGGAISVLELSGAKEAMDDYDIVTEVIASLTSVDTTNHRPDYVNSGILDNLTVIVQAEATDRGDYLYPHKAVYPGDGRIAGYYVRNYNFVDMESVFYYNGYNYSYNGGVLAHEFLHSVGLPDLYRYSGSGDPVGTWDIMAGTSRYLQYPLAYSRETLGWLTLPSVTPENSQSSYTVDCASADTGTAGYKLSTPLSDDEYFVVEYRKHNNVPYEIPYANDHFGFETKIPGSGLLIYRVDNTVPGLTNASGENYIYIFRPDPTVVNDAATATTGSAIDPGAGETSFGSTDLSKTFADNTIYYADGTNSGISLSNIAYSQDGESISFDVDFADYSSLGLWDARPFSPAVSNASSPSICADGAGNVYVAYSQMPVETNYTYVQKHNGSSWSNVGSAITGATDAKVYCWNSGVYLACVTGSSSLTVYKLVNNSWATQFSDSADYPRDIEFFSDTEGIYLSYVKSDTTLVVKTVENSGGGKNILASQSLSVATYMTHPSVCRYNGSFYVLYAAFAGGTAAHIAKLEGTEWTDIQDVSIQNSNTHSVAVGGGNMYVLCGKASPAEFKLLKYDGTTFTETGLPSLPSNVVDASLIYSGSLHLGYIQASNNTAKVFAQGDSGFTQLGSDVASSVDTAEFTADGSDIYSCTLSASESKTLGVRYKTLTNTEDDLTVTLTPPSTFTDANIWFDGIDVSATGSGSYTATAPSNACKTAVMYEYNARGVPTGMYVWRLEFANNRYTATPVSQMEDILSYHGFAIRVKGYSGIRFKSGITPASKSALLSQAGLAGYKLEEYGTVVMNAANFGAYNFVKGGKKTSSGAAYWKDSGGTHDMIFEEKDGRMRFTSVLTNIEVPKYRTNYAFRAYMILSYNGEEYMIYGPPVARSIYTVATQVMAAGEFAQGTVQYNFVQGIIDSAA